MAAVAEFMRTQMPTLYPIIKALRIGPGRDAKIEARFSAPVADVFFVNMSVTVMAGLGFASVLTLIVVPTLYAICFCIGKAPA